MDIAKKQEKFEQVVHANLKMWQCTAYNMCSNTELADDIVQDALTHAWHNLDKLKNVTSIEAWIYRIVVNTACSVLRSEKKRRQIIKAVDPVTIAQSAQNMQTETAPQFLNDAEAELQKHMAELPLELSATLLLSVVDKKTTTEIAQIMGINPATVYWRIHKSRKLLKKALKEKGVHP